MSYRILIDDIIVLEQIRSKLDQRCQKKPASEYASGKALHYHLRVPKDCLFLCNSQLQSLYPSQQALKTRLHY